MMKQLKVLDKYPIFIGEDFSEMIKQFPLEKYSKIFIITDQIVGGLFLSEIQKSIPVSETIIVQGGEEAKKIESVQKIWKELHDKGADRKSLVINLGGGVIGDMGGFAASTYMRGIDFLQIPTTLLAQVDASVGGKVGVDFNEIKNLIGSFNQPIGVIINVAVLKKLPSRVLNSGFGEIIKHGLIKDATYFDIVRLKKPEFFLEPELTNIISRSCEIKIEIMSQDVQEAGLRKILNFGHTVGHAVESLSWKTNSHLLHGEAVSVGMVVEARISQKMHFLEAEDVELIISALENASLPTEIGPMDVGEILEVIKSDKKNEGGVINWTLLRGIGNAVFDQKVKPDIVTEALYESV